MDSQSDPFMKSKSGLKSPNYPNYKLRRVSIFGVAVLELGTYSVLSYLECLGEVKRLPGGTSGISRPVAPTWSLASGLSILSWFQGVLAAVKPSAAQLP